MGKFILLACRVSLRAKGNDYNEDAIDVVILGIKFNILLARLNVNQS
jgi:hypothetical protein